MNSKLMDYTQESNTKPELVFWFDCPPRAGAGVFSYVAKNWGTRVYYMCISTRKDQRAGAWKDCDHSTAEIIILDKISEPICFVKEFIKKNPNAIHVCNGFNGKSKFYFYRILFKIKGCRIIMWSERPGAYGSILKKTIKRFSVPVLYRYYFLRYGKKIKVLMPLGLLGVKTFAGYGWPISRLFPFMYDPQICDKIPETSPRKISEPLRLLYVGRFSCATKGVDVLIKAIDNIPGDNWHLDIVGGYGDYKDFTIAWAKKTPNVSFVGIWPSNEVSQRITQYDVCCVPSRFDGWNVVINEAIHAGIGVIATDESVSSELITASGAGMVISAGNVHALQQALQQVIDNPSIAEIWKKMAIVYSIKISSKSVACYFMDVLQYTFLEPSRLRPECPWL